MGGLRGTGGAVSLLSPHPYAQTSPVKTATSLGASFFQHQAFIWQRLFIIYYIL